MGGPLRSERQQLVALLVYGIAFSMVSSGEVEDVAGLVVAAMLAAFAGSFGATRPMPKVTLGSVRTLVGVMLVFVGLGLASGVL